MTNLHQETRQAMRGLWKGAGQGIGGFEDKYLSVPGVWSPHTALHDYMRGPPLDGSSDKISQQADKGYADLLKRINKTNFNAPAPATIQGGPQATTAAPTPAASRVGVGGSITAV